METQYHVARKDEANKTMPMAHTSIQHQRRGITPNRNLTNYESQNFLAKG